MARFTDDEKGELLRATCQGEAGASSDSVASEPPRPRVLTPLEYVEFASFASLFDRSIKPVAFDGEHWKL